MILRCFLCSHQQLQQMLDRYEKENAKVEQLGKQCAVLESEKQLLESQVENTSSSCFLFDDYAIKVNRMNMDCGTYSLESRWLTFM